MLPFTYLEDVKSLLALSKSYMFANIDYNEKFIANLLLLKGLEVTSVYFNLHMYILHTILYRNSSGSCLGSPKFYYNKENAVRGGRGLQTTTPYLRMSRHTGFNTRLRKNWVLFCSNPMPDALCVYSADLMLKLIGVVVIYSLCSGIC